MAGLGDAVSGLSGSVAELQLSLGAAAVGCAA